MNELLDISDHVLRSVEPENRPSVPINNGVLAAVMKLEQKQQQQQ